MIHEDGFKQNEYCWKGNSWKDAMGEQGLGTTDFKYTLNKVPFTFKVDDKETDMFVRGGLFGVSVCKEDNALLPIFGYAVTQDKTK